jgi:hypothetical protein
MGGKLPLTRAALWWNFELLFHPEVMDCDSVEFEVVPAGRLEPTLEKEPLRRFAGLDVDATDAACPRR